MTEEEFLQHANPIKSWGLASARLNIFLFRNSNTLSVGVGYSFVFLVHSRMFNTRYSKSIIPLAGPQLQLLTNPIPINKTEWSRKHLEIKVKSICLETLDFNGKFLKSGLFAHEDKSA